MDSESSDNGPQNPPPSGGKGDALRQYNETRLEYRAVAHGWLKNENGLGLDAERLARVASRNVEIALSSSDPRAVTASTRNVVAMVGQVMEQEKRDAGGEVLNVNVNDGSDPTDDLDQLSEDQLARRHLAALADSRRSQHASPRGN